MAVLQISKIQVRRGQKSQSGIPTLSAGEFAWAVDAQELYIGNGSVSEGAPYVGNTRLLTELDATNLFQLANTYTYEGNTAATIITGVDANSPVQRTLQDKLDDYVSLADFGAVGDGVSDDTKALQRAIDQTYLNSDKGVGSLAGKRLRFPAGTYKITGTIYVPSFATIEGDGIDRTVIKQATTATAIFQTVDFTSTAASKVTFETGLPFNQQPRNISMSGMTLKYTDQSRQTVGAMIYVDCALDSTIEKMKFEGVAVGNDPTVDTQECIQLRGKGETTTRRLKIRDCEFKHISYGITSDYDVYDIEISNNKFDQLHTGVKFAETLSGISPSRVGPVRVLVNNNTFDNIFRSAVRGGSNPSNTPTYISSRNNKFYNVGNELDLNLEENQLHSVLDVASPGMTSTNDWFARTVSNLSGVTGQLVSEISGHIDYQPLATRNLSLAVSSLPVTIAVLPGPSTGSASITIDYIAKQSSLNVTRVGTVHVTAGGTTSTWYDNFQYVGANTLVGDIQFSASLNTTTNMISVDVTNPVGSVDTTLTYKYNVLY